MIKASWLYSAFADRPLAFEMLLGLVRQRNAQAFGANETGPFCDWPLGGDDLILAQQIALVLEPIGRSVAELFGSSSVVVVSVENSDLAYSAKQMLVQAADAHFELMQSLGDDEDDAGEIAHPLPVISLLDRSGYRGQMRELFSKAYRTEAFVICIVFPGSDEEDLTTMRLAADRDLELPDVTAEHVGRVFLSLFKERPGELDALVGLKNLDADKLGAALRPARTLEECLSAISAVAGGPAEPVAAPFKPGLQDAAGFGEAREWALDLASDYALWQAGDLQWDEVPERGVLISGPPGTGKTTFARLLANTLERPLIETSVAAWSGFDNLSGTIVEMNRVFSQAQSLQAVLFIDELDGINRRDQADERSRYWDQVVNHLLTRVNNILESPGVVVVGATNYPGKIDPALLRAGRIERHIRVVHPGVQDRAIILDQYLKGALEQSDVQRIATHTDRFSGADLKRLARGSMARARRDKRTLTMADVLTELARDTETLSVKDRRRALIYAAGRELVSRSLGPGLGQWPEYLTLADLQDQMTVMMAGRAAEELVFNSVSTLGEEDLERATEMAEAIEIKFGMGTSGPLALHLVPQAWDLTAAVRQHIEQALEKAHRVLDEKMGELEVRAAETNDTKRVVH